MIQSPEHTSVSLVLETANLELADIGLLRRSLESLAAQSMDIALAEDIVMVDGGDVPDDMLQALVDDFPWLRIEKVAPGIGYEEAKLVGVAATRGDIVVFFDADCVYDPGWLRGLLDDGLLRRPDLGVLGGETMIVCDTVWGMASALLFSFNFYSDREEIYEHTRFHWNNVAIRRSVLAAHVIPTRQPLFRASTLMYSSELRNAGIGVGRQPLSRARHAAPNGWTHFFWRYLMFGHDAATVTRLLQAQEPHSPSPSRQGDEAPTFLGLLGDRFKTTRGRVGYLLREKSENWRRLPAALVLMWLGWNLMLTGYLFSRFAPGLLPSLVPAEIKRGSGLETGGAE